MEKSKTDSQNFLKPSLSIKKGIDSLLVKKSLETPPNKRILTFIETEQASSESLSRHKSKKTKKLTHLELMAKVEAKYLSHNTISTMAKLELEKRFTPNEEEMIKK